MKNILYYFYLICFVLLVGSGVIALVGKDESFGFVILLQLIWGPISALHCLLKLAANFKEKTKFTKLYASSFIATILYFVIVSIISSTGMQIDAFSEDTLFVVGVIIIPWIMLAFFTYILHLEKSEANLTLA